MLPIINPRHQQQWELTGHSVSQGSLFGNLDSNRTRTRGDLELLTPAALQRHPIPGIVFCFDAASHPGMVLSQQLARRVHFEDATPEAEVPISHVDGAENQITDKMTMTRIL
jgi:hypothetical protein